MSHREHEDRDLLNGWLGKLVGEVYAEVEAIRVGNDEAEQVERDRQEQAAAAAEAKRVREEERQRSIMAGRGTTDRYFVDAQGYPEEGRERYWEHCVLIRPVAESYEDVFCIAQGDTAEQAKERALLIASLLNHKWTNGNGTRGS